MKYTLVQHTGWSTGRRPDFMRAVEERSISDEEAKQVRRTGGLVFDTYAEARDRAYVENYPVGVEGLIPLVRGKFVAARGLLGESLYVPKES